MGGQLHVLLKIVGARRVGGIARLNDLDESLGGGGEDDGVVARGQLHYNH